MYFLDHVVGSGGASGMTGRARVRAVEAVAAERPIALKQRTGDGPLAAEPVFAAAAQGDSLAGEVLDRISERFARAISVMATFLNPELVVIGGAVVASAQVLLEPIAPRSS